MKAIRKNMANFHISLHITACYQKEELTECKGQFKRDEEVERKIKKNQQKNKHVKTF